MRFSELSIQTQRAAPSELRTPGLAFLYRAGYLSRSLEPLALGRLAVDKMRRTSAGMDPLEFLSRLGLQLARADAADEVYALHPAGPQEILLCPACGYADPVELARSSRQPFSLEAPLPLEKVLTPGCGTIAQLAEFLKIPQQKTAKALMYTRLADQRFVFVVVRGDMQLSEPKLKAQLGDFRLATAQEIVDSGAVAGYASPVGLKNALVVVDELVTRSPNLVAGANQPGYHLQNTNIPRDYRAGLVADLTLAAVGDPCPSCSTPLASGQATAVFSAGGFLFDRLLSVLAEVHHDEKGLCLPSLAAPFDVYLMNVPGKSLDTAGPARDLHAQISAAGLAVLFDDRDERAGVKFNDADLIGCPLRVTVGERGLGSEMVEVKRRRETENKQVPLGSLLSEIQPG